MDLVIYVIKQSDVEIPFGKTLRNINQFFLCLATMSDYKAKDNAIQLLYMCHKSLNR
jgi:hypothetical protein